MLMPSGCSCCHLRHVATGSLAVAADPHAKPNAKALQGHPTTAWRSPGVDPPPDEQRVPLRLRNHQRPILTAESSGAPDAIPGE